MLINIKVNGWNIFLNYRNIIILAFTNTDDLGQL